MMKELIDEIQRANSLIYRIMIYGREHYGDNWSKTARYIGGITWAAFWFESFIEDGERYKKFAEYEIYWYNLEKDLRYKEVESQGYGVRMKKYLKQYLRPIWHVDYQKLMRSAFITDLLEDGYISHKEADDFCKLFVDVHDKEVKDVKRACKIILEITSQNVEADSKTPALDFLFHLKENLRNRFIAFFKAKHGKLKITASDVVQMLFFVLDGRSRFDALEGNGFNQNHLWNDLRLVGVIGNVVKNVCDRTLNTAAQKALQPKPDVKTAWESFRI